MPSKKVNCNDKNSLEGKYQVVTRSKTKLFNTSAGRIHVIQSDSKKCKKKKRTIRKVLKKTLKKMSDASENTPSIVKNESKLLNCCPNGNLPRNVLNNNRHNQNSHDNSERLFTPQQIQKNFSTNNNFLVNKSYDIFESSKSVLSPVKANEIDNSIKNIQKFTTSSPQHSLILAWNKNSSGLSTIASSFNPSKASMENIKLNANEEASTSHIIPENPTINQIRQSNNIPNVVLPEDRFINNVSGMVRYELWKKRQLYDLQKGNLSNEVQKLNLFKRIFSTFYSSIFKGKK